MTCPGGVKISIQRECHRRSISLRRGLEVLMSGKAKDFASAFSLALRSSDGSVWAWGSNGSGLGDGSSTQSNLPVQVKDVGGATLLTAVTAIAAGNSHMLVLKGGTVLAWGANSNGQLGDGS